MSYNIAINGFGRIGRNILRAHIERADSAIRIVAINDLAPIEHAAFLLEYDSVHGHLAADIRHDDDHIYINDLPPVRYIQLGDPAKLEWNAMLTFHLSWNVPAVLPLPRQHGCIFKKGHRGCWYLRLLLVQIKPLSMALITPRSPMLTKSFLLHPAPQIVWRPWPSWCMKPVVCNRAL